MSFKSGTAKNRSYRKKTRDSDEEDEPENIKSALEEAKLLQSLRQRASGVAVDALLKAKEIKEEEEEEDDPYKLKTGGLVNMKEVKDRNRDRFIHLSNCIHPRELTTV
eukprot:Colp12_sorted_trinity150504_noHs@31137